MDWLLGTLLCVVIAAWIWRERRLRQRIVAIDATMDEAINHREPAPAPAPLKGAYHRLALHVRQVASEVVSVRRQRQLAEQNLRIILSSMEEAVIVVDSHRTLRMVNPSARKLFELANDAHGVPVLEALREPVLDAMIAHAMSEGTSEARDFFLPSRKVPLTLSARVTPLRDAAGEAGALAMFRDVTRLTQLEKVRSEFVANVSHELRTPLAIFQGYVENLVDQPEMPREDQAATFNVLERHSKRLNALVEDLLILARLEARTNELEVEPFEVPKFCAEMAQDWSIRMKKKEVTLLLELEPNLPPLEADRLRMEQVFNNLLDNALKYTPSGNTITLGAARRGERLEMWVKDTGQGILSSDLPHIFERFYRADKARSRELGGTGLGLSIVKHIAQAHGGSVNADSVFGKGTTIRVYLPIPNHTVEAEPASDQAS